VVKTVIEVGPQRYRESFGRYYEDFKVGDVYEHRPGRTLTENDNIQFTLLTMNTHPAHFDSAYAAKTEFGKPLMNSTFTLSVVVGMSVSDVSQKAIANLGWTDIKLTAPVFAGDTIYAESKVMATRVSASRANQGIVTVETIGLKSDQTKFISFVRSVLVPFRGHGMEESANY
jgi:itaconyl-CoA hydratase